MKSIFSNSNKIGDKFKTVLTNRGLLYILFALSVGNLFYLGSENDMMTIAVFILTGFLTSFFSKNMVVILCIALVVSSIIKYGVSLSDLSSEKEGFTISEGLTPDEKEKVRAAVEGLLGDPKKPQKNDETEKEETESENKEEFEDREESKTQAGNTRANSSTVSGNTTAKPSTSGNTTAKK
jgi:hypothetical protein